jgi:hypothetical protein
MTIGANNKEGMLGSFHGVLIGSRELLVLRWMMLEKVLGVGALRSLAILVRQAFPSGGLRLWASLPSTP